MSPAFARPTPRVAGIGLTLLALALALPVQARSAPETPEPSPPAGAPSGAAAAPATSKPGAASEAPSSREPIPIAQIPSRSQTLASQLRALETELREAALATRAEQSLGELGESLRSRLVTLDQVLATTPSLTELDDLLGAWRAFGEGPASLERELRTRATELEAQLARLEGLRGVWTQTAAAARDQAAPPSILDETRRSLELLATARQAFEARRNAVLDLQSRLADHRGRVSETVARIEAVRAQSVADIWVRDRPPLWRVSETLAADTSLGTELERWSTAMLRTLEDYASRQRERLLVHVLLVLGILWLLRRGRRTVEQRAGRDESGRTARDAFAHPVAAALVLGLSLTGLLHPQAPTAVRHVAGVVLLVPLLVVLRPLLEPALHPILAALAIFFLTDRIRDILEGVPLLGRLLFLAEMLVAAGGLLWLLRSSRLAGLPDALRTSAWLGALSFWARAALLALVLAFGAGALGYMRGAQLVGEAALGSAYAALVLYAGVRIAEGLLSVALRGRRLRRLRSVAQHGERIEARLRPLLRLGAVALWGLTLLDLLALRGAVLGGLGTLLSRSFGFGSVSFSLGGLLGFVLTLWLAWTASRLLAFTLEEEVYPRFSLPRGVPFALSTLGRYAVIVVGFLMAVAALGFDLDRLTIVAGALGVGIGFGLQNVVNNFVSGLILLFERPVQVGDRVQLAELLGQIRRIGIRSSTIRTLEGADVIVPNSNLISDRVVNWTLSDRNRRFSVKVGLSYGTDPQPVIEVLTRAAAGVPDVLENPRPQALFVGFGDSSLDFEIRAWTAEDESWMRVQSEVALAIHAALREAGMEIPFPQRDLHLRSISAGARQALAQPGADASAPVRGEGATR